MKAIADRVKTLTVLLVVALVSVNAGCGASQKPAAEVPVGTIFGFLVELIANPGNEEFPEGQKHAAIVMIPARNPRQAEQELVTAAQDAGWKLATVLQRAEGYSETGLAESPELAAAMEEAKQGKNVIVVFSDPISTPPTPASRPLPTEQLRP